MNKQEILDRTNKEDFYKNLLPSLKVNGKKEALGLCPVHGDTHPSLSVNLETGLFRCFSCNFKGDMFTFYQRVKGVDFPTALQEIGKMAGVVKLDIKTVATFKYTDEAGNLLYIKERLEPGRNGRAKEFVFKRMEGDRWVLGRGCEPILYNLPALSKSKYAFVVEGESKADLLNKWGFVATCLDNGANSPIKDEYIQILASMEKVVILPDNDSPGRAYASKIASVLHDKIKELKAVELPGLSEAEDVIDWTKTAGNNKAKLIEIVKNTPVWTAKENDKQNSTMVLTRLDSLFKEPEDRTTWLVDELLPSGGFSVMVAKPKVGKSTNARTLALHVARGEPFLNRNVTKGSVIYLALEEKRSEVKKHFKDMGATGNEEIHIYTGGTPVDAIKQIREAVERLEPVLVIIDPLFRLTKVKDGNDYIQVTNALDPLLRLARDTGTHVLCVHHSPKGERVVEDSILGSQAIFGSVDTLLVMKRLENYRTIQTRQRYGDDMEETVLDFAKKTRLVTIGGTKQEEDINMVKKAIIDFLSTQNEPITEAVINQGIEGAVKFKCKALRELVAEGKVKREGKGSRGNPFYYSTILLPSIYVEVEKENSKKTGNPHGCKGYSTISEFTKIPKDEKSKIVEFLQKNRGKNEQKKLVLGVPFEVESIEVEA
jgi:5S rRNA maturation endonuclease (ribonuclease M5)